jgi:hypothetical protein
VPRLLVILVVASGLLLAAVVGGVAALGGSSGETQPRLAAATAAAADGTTSSARTYVLEVSARTDDRIAFRLRREGDRPFGTLKRWQERPLHALLVRRDLGAFARLEVEGSVEDGFSAPLPALEPGPYRLVVDFTVGKNELALGADLTVSGPYEERPLPAVDVPDPLGDGRVVAVSHRTLYARANTPVSFALADEAGALPLEPHLSARGFLALFRPDTLAYTHGHPAVRDQALFSTLFPSDGRWVAFFEHRVDGERRVARFLLEVNPASA